MRQPVVIWCDRTPNDLTAETNLQTGEIWLSKSKMAGYKPNVILFITLHEKAHYLLQTYSELHCDAWAFYQYTAKGLPLSDVIDSLAEVLDFDSGNPEYWERFDAMNERAYGYDKTIRKN